MGVDEVRKSVVADGEVGVVGGFKGLEGESGVKVVGNMTFITSPCAFGWVNRWENGIDTVVGDTQGTDSFGDISNGIRRLPLQPGGAVGVGAAGCLVQGLQSVDSGNRYGGRFLECGSVAPGAVRVLGGGEVAEATGYLGKLGVGKSCDKEKIQHCTSDYYITSEHVPSKYSQ